MLNDSEASGVSALPKSKTTLLTTDPFAFAQGDKGILKLVSHLSLQPNNNHRRYCFIQAFAYLYPNKSLSHMDQKPSNAFIGASWTALIVGFLGYIIGLWNAQMVLNEKGYYFVVLLFGLFASVSVQKSVRDRLEGIAVTNIYYGLSWACTIIAILLLTVGLWNASLTLSEKGFYAMAFLLTMFAAIAVQKNTRDLLNFEKLNGKSGVE